MALTKAQAAAEVMLHLCEHAAHGYSQPARKGDGTTETVTLSDGTKVHVHGGDMDCSEAVRSCWAAVGVLPYDSYMWTGNEDELLTSHGFERLDFDKSSLKVGDVLWKSGHTEMVVKPGYQGGFNGDENGGLGQGAKVGDQTGYESWVKPVRDYWTRVYRYKQTYKEGWVKSGKRWWYQYKDGTWPANKWLKWHDHWYYFDSEGWMVEKDWVLYVPKTINGKTNTDNHACWYWLKDGGKMASHEVLYIDGKPYAFHADGSMIEGEIKLRKGGSLIL